jgi:hypothetical protein
LEHQQPWHVTLPTTIDAIPISGGAGRLANGVPLASLEMLRALMLQLQTAYVPGNHDIIERKCRDKAKKLDTIHRPVQPTVKKKWFRAGMAGLHRSKRQVTNSEVGETVVATRKLRGQLEAAGPSTFAGAEAAAARLKADFPDHTNGLGEPEDPVAKRLRESNNRFVRHSATGSDGGAT